MTVIAAYTDGRTAALGYDSGSTHGDVVKSNRLKRPFAHQIVSPKGKPRGRLVIAACGMHRIGIELAHRWTPPTRARTWRAERYMLEVTTSLQHHLAHADAFAQQFVRDDHPHFLDGEMLAICDASVFLIGCEFSLSEPACGYLGSGSGGQVALGAMAALAESGRPPAEVVAAALDVAHEHVAGILPPFHIETTTR